jgi:hypothetical protein
MNIRIFLPLFLLTFLLSGSAALAAKASDADNIPHIDQQGKDAFREFLAAGKHRAFVIAPGGAWAWKANETTAESALENATLECQQGSEQPCVPYVVNDRCCDSLTRASAGTRPFNAWHKYDVSILS